MKVHKHTNIGKWAQYPGTLSKEIVGKGHNPLWKDFAPELLFIGNKEGIHEGTRQAQLA